MGEEQDTSITSFSGGTYPNLAVFATSGSED